MKHTKIPWRRNKHASMLVEHKNRSIASTGGYQNVSKSEEVHDENEANAAFIVKACNSFYGLLEALENVDDFMNGHDDGLGLHQVVIDAIKQAKEDES